MLSFKHDKGSREIAIVVGDKQNKTLHLNYDENVKSNIKNGLSLNVGSFIPVPDRKKDSSVYLICGTRGSGKTTLATHIAKQYNRVKENNKVYIFTQNYKQPIFDEIDNCEIVNLNENCVLSPFTLEEFSDSLCLFDDIHTLGFLEIVHKIPSTLRGKPVMKDKYIKHDLSKIVTQFRDNIIQNGRHHRISCISISHMITNYKESRCILEEADYIIYFKSCGKMHVQRLLETYMGFSKEQRKMIDETEGRWKMISKQIPQYIMSQSDVFML